MGQGFWQEMLLRAPITAILAALSAAVTFFFTKFLEAEYLRRYRIKILTQIEQGEKKYNERSIVMVLSVLNRISQAVEQYMQEVGKDGLRFVEIHEDRPFDHNDPGMWSSYLERVKEEIRKAREAGVQRIYLFAQLPVAMAAIVGAAFTNGPEVVVHHYQQGRYYQVGRIAPETVRFF